MPSPRGGGLGDRKWDIYHAVQGRGDVISFLPTNGGQNRIMVNMKPMIQYCVDQGWLTNTQYMTSLQAGWEIIAGGTFRTTAFAIDPATF